jgi:hypothetical protein
VLQGRLEYSQSAEALCRLPLTFPDDRAMASLCSLVASRLGLAHRVEAVQPVVKGWCMAALFPGPKEEWWRRRWSVRKALMLQQDLVAQQQEQREQEELLAEMQQTY